MFATYYKKKKRNLIKKKKPHPLIDLRRNMPEKQVIFFVRPYLLLQFLTRGTLTLGDLVQITWGNTSLLFATTPEYLSGKSVWLVSNQEVRSSPNLGWILELFHLNLTL